MKNNVIELTPYLPVQALPAQATEPAKRSGKDALPYLSALVESVVTVGIGFCFVVGVVLSLIIAL